MKEIKVRCWNKTQKRWVSPGPTVCCANTVEICPVDSRNDDEEVILLTGLRDRNGREIWEGDILEVFFEFNEGANKGYVTYDDDKGSFWIESENEGMPFSAAVDFGDFEVIGNIYENPELLKQ